MGRKPQSAPQPQQPLPQQYVFRAVVAKVGGLEIFATHYGTAPDAQTAMQWALDKCAAPGLGLHVRSVELLGICAFNANP